MSEPYTPAQVFAPGDFVYDEMEARGWSISEVAKRMRVEPELVAALLRAECRVTTRIAFALWRCFGVSPESWEAHELVYRQWPGRQVAPRYGNPDREGHGDA